MKVSLKQAALGWGQFFWLFLAVFYYKREGWILTFLQGQYGIYLLYIEYTCNKIKKKKRILEVCFPFPICERSQIPSQFQLKAKGNEQNKKLNWKSMLQDDETTKLSNVIIYQTE